jgi:hypothetical protein
VDEIKGTETHNENMMQTNKKQTTVQKGAVRAPSIQKVRQYENDSNFDNISKMGHSAGPVNL